MMGAKYKWTHDAFNKMFAVYRWIEGSTVYPWSRHVPGRWERVYRFEMSDAVAGRKKCEQIIEGLSAPKVTFYYDKDGRQLPGFDTE